MTEKEIMQTEIDRLKEKLKMAMEDLEHRCSSCWYEATSSMTAPCCNCIRGSRWRWRGDDDGESC